MKYETLYTNDNGTVKVRMTIGTDVLEQDFEATDLDNNVKLGMAVFKAEIDRNSSAPVDESLVGKTVSVSKLPIIPPEDFQPEQPEGE